MVRSFLFFAAMVVLCLVAAYVSVRHKPGGPLGDYFQGAGVTLGALAVVFVVVVLVM